MQFVNLHILFNFRMPVVENECPEGNAEGLKILRESLKKVIDQFNILYIVFCTICWVQFCLYCGWIQSPSIASWAQLIIFIFGWLGYK